MYVKALNPETGEQKLVDVDSLGGGGGGVAAPDGPAGTFRVIEFKTDGKLRARLGLDNVLETGDNTGSNFFIEVFADDGVTSVGKVTLERILGTLTNTGEIAAKSFNTTP